MSRPFMLHSTIGRTRNVDLEDIHRTKKALRDLGFYRQPRYGITRYPDEALFRGIEDFQRNRGLRVDGTMKPGGETERALESVLRTNGVPSPSPMSATAGETTKSPRVRRYERNDETMNGSASGNTELAFAFAPAIPAIVYEIAQYFGMAVMAAYAWWMSMSDNQKEQIRQKVNDSENDEDGDREDCDYIYYNVDIPTCNAIEKRRGKRAGARCRATAAERYAACLKGVPKDQWPPLDTWNN